MPSALSYPGVYIEELESGVRTVTGVATSIAAFVGRALRGPVNEAQTINSFGDFERIFGGLWTDSTLGFALRDFFLNGGSQAIVVRLFHEVPEPAAPAPEAGLGGAKAVALVKGIAGKFSLDAGGISLEAASHGAWGVNLRVTVDKSASPDVAKRMGVRVDALFNLSVRDTDTGDSERILNLTVIESARRIDRALKAESALVAYRGELDPKNPPTVTAGADGLSVKEAAVAAAQKALADKLNAKPSDDVNAERKAVEDAKSARDKALAEAVKIATDGGPLTSSDFLPAGGEANKQGLYALEKSDLFNLLCLPPYTTSNDVDPNVVSAAAVYCERRRALLLVDSPSGWGSKDQAKSGMATAEETVGTRSRNAALFFPRLRQANPLRENQVETFAACGAIAGVFARTDVRRGVWKAPAGLDAGLVGVQALSAPLTDAENGELNPLGLNCLRAFPAAGLVVWGSRTLRGADQLADEYKYVPVRRTALFIEESLYRGLKWVVFEPNDEPLWGQIRLNVGAFMHDLYRKGAFQGKSAREAYFVKCDKESTTQNDVNLGVVNIVVGFAPLKPAEFVVVKIQQMAGQVAVE